MSPLRRLLPYVRRYRRLFVVGLVCSVVTTVIALAIPLVLRLAVDDLTQEVTRQKLLAYAGALVGIGLIGGLFRFLTRRILIGASRHIEYDLRNDFFAHLQRLPLSYFQVHRTGDLMSRATNDLNAVRMMIGPSIMYSSNTVLTFVAALALMLSIDGWLTLVSLIPLPFVSISVKYFGTAIHTRFEQIQAQLSEVSAVAQESLSGVRVVRAYRQEQSELDRLAAGAYAFWIHRSVANVAATDIPPAPTAQAAPAAAAPTAVAPAAPVPAAIAPDPQPGTTGSAPVGATASAAGAPTKGAPASAKPRPAPAPRAKSPAPTPTRPAPSGRDELDVGF